MPSRAPVFKIDLIIQGQSGQIAPDLFRGQHHGEPWVQYWRAPELFGPLTVIQPESAVAEKVALFKQVVATLVSSTKGNGLICVNPSVVEVSFSEIRRHRTCVPTHIVLSGGRPFINIG